MKKYIFFFVGLLFLVHAQAGLLFNYSQLALKDLDQMNKMVRAKIAESKKAGGNKVIPLKEALQAIFSRSNEDFMIEKILPPLKTELDEFDAYEKALQALVKEAIGALKNPKAFSPVVQVTYQIFLENIISEMKPRLGEPFEHKLMTQIRDAKITITKEAANERRLRVMKETTSPSVIAEGVLNDYEAQKQNQKQEAPADSAASASSSEESKSK